MACSPLLKGVTDPEKILRIVAEHHILRYSETSFVFYPLRDLGWMEYKEGHWHITSEGRSVLSKEPEDKPVSVTEFLGIG